MKRRDWLCSGSALALSAGVHSVWAQQPLAGKDYRVLGAPVATTATSGKVEVLEFFGYWCPHCNALEPSLEAWIKTLPKEVIFNRVPVYFGPKTEGFQKLFYALEAMGLLGSMHSKVFAAIHKDKKNLDSDAAIRAWVSSQGVDATKFQAAYTAFGVQAKAKRAATLTTAYEIEGVPSMAVAGKYLVSNSPKMLATVLALAKANLSK